MGAKMKQFALSCALLLVFAQVAAAKAERRTSDTSGDGGTTSDRLSGLVKSTVRAQSAVRDGCGRELPERHAGRPGHGRPFRHRRRLRGFCRGETDVSNASRPIEDDERQAVTGGIDSSTSWLNDALTIVVNKDNDWVDCLTRRQAEDDLAPSSKVISWKDADPSWPTSACASSAREPTRKCSTTHRRDHRDEEGGSPPGLLGERVRQRDRAGSLRRQGCARLLRPLVLPSRTKDRA